MFATTTNVKLISPNMRIYSETKEGLRVFEALIKEIYDWRGRLRSTIRQRLHIIQEVLITDIILLRDEDDKTKANDLLIEIKDTIAGIKTKMVDDLFPSVKLSDDDDRLKIVLRAITVMDCILSFNNTVDLPAASTN